MQRKRSRLAISFVAAASVASVLAGCRGGGGGGTNDALPIIFVHGIYGSGDQYRAEALRFASNGFPAEKVKMFDYDSTANLGVGVPLDAFVDKVRTQFGVAKVNLVGHSLGTSVVNSYVGAHAAKVNRYVLVDGLTCSGGGACLAISEFNLPAVGGGTQTHVESTVSPESFAKQYEFLLGRRPATTDVVAEQGPIRIAGKALEFQANTPLTNTRVEIWNVDQSTGRRTGAAPVGTSTTGADGYFAPITVTAGKAYEIAYPRQGVGTFHFYYQPFVRTDLELHLSSLGPNSAGMRNSNRDPKAAAVTVVRNREFWRGKGAQNDGLVVQTSTSDGRSQPAVDVFKNVTGNVVGVWLQDDAATPGTSSLDKLTYFSSQPFQTGVDIFMPAASPPNGTITVVNTPRGNTAKKQTVNAANWPASSDAVLVELNDWVQ